MRDSWTRDQLLLAFNLYCKIPFSKTTTQNPKIVHLARILGRSPSALAMKLGNFGSFDPALRARGISGLTGASKADKAIWNEFNENWEGLAIESESAMERVLMRKSDAGGASLPKLPSGPSEALRETKVRLHQKFFSQTVLSAYGHKCCICKITVPGLLTAGHIIPWALREDLRANPHNGLCLCSLHHDAFDCGLWTVDEKHKVLVSTELKRYLPNEVLEVAFQRSIGKVMTLPDKFQPDPEFLSFHRRERFQQEEKHEKGQAAPF